VADIRAKNSQREPHTVVGDVGNEIGEGLLSGTPAGTASTRQRSALDLAEALRHQMVEHLLRLAHQEAAAGGDPVQVFFQ